MIGPELGVTQPGMTIVCGDSHTSTHGAFGALAFGIGTSEVEHVLATQTLPSAARRRCASRFEGLPGRGVMAKDMILGLIGQSGTDGVTGYVVEYTGEAIRALSMEGRMTVCNMSIEGGARAGFIAPDETTFALPRGPPWRAGPRATSSTGERYHGRRRDLRPRGRRRRRRAGAAWSPGAPTRARSIAVTGRVPEATTPTTSERALAYMGLEPGTAMRTSPIDRVFIGSCTNGRIEDLRAAAGVVEGQHVVEERVARWSCPARWR